jgi:hypothetical protein
MMHGSGHDLRIHLVVQMKLRIDVIGDKGGKGGKAPV